MTFMLIVGWGFRRDDFDGDGDGGGVLLIEAWVDG